MERKLSYKEKIVNVSDVVKHVRNKDNLVVIEGEDGSGKTTLLA
jgi:ABC-type lipoprotein export system ATPase subunit